MNIYVDLTREFNAERLRAIICSGQAVVVHRLAIMSKDGHWILAENDESLQHVLRVLENHGARYRFGAPLDRRWMSGGWSAHFEFAEGGLRVRTDFFTRPPRIEPEELASIWRKQAGQELLVIDIKNLAEMKKTNREKDYPIIGELARLLEDPGDALMLSRSARDLCDLAARHPELIEQLTPFRRLLSECPRGVEAVERALDEERRALIRLNEARLQRFRRAASKWQERWPTVAAEVAELPLRQAHDRILVHASGVLPFEPDHGTNDD